MSQITCADVPPECTLGIAGIPVEKGSGNVFADLGCPMSMGSKSGPAPVAQYQPRQRH